MDNIELPDIKIPINNNLRKLKIILIKEIIKNRENTKINIKRLNEDINNLIKSEAASRIQSKYREKIISYESKKEISNLLCNNIDGGKNIYRTKIKEILEKNQNKDYLKLIDMFFYFCKFGKKILGYDNSGIKDLIKEINNCLFFNVSFSSTNLSNIQFKNTKFIYALHKSELYDKLFDRNKKLFSIKNKYSNQDKFIFENANLINCNFENCYFIKIDFKNNSLGITKNFNNLYNYPCPIFLNCKFMTSKIFFPFNIKNENINFDDAKYNNYKKNYSMKFVSIDESNLNLRTTILFPDLIFENTTFDKNCFFLTYKSVYYEEKIYFKNCIFDSVYFDYLQLKNVYFEKCKFIKCDFLKSKTIDVVFNNCEILNCDFDNVQFGNEGITEFINCSIINNKFVANIFHNYLTRRATTIFHNNNNIENCKFIQSLLIGFKFNYNSSISNDNKLLNLKKNRFISCKLYGTNFDNCDLEGSNFAATTDSINYFNWFGNIIIFNPVKPSYGIDKTDIIDGIFGDDFNEFKGESKRIKESRTRTKYVLEMKYHEYDRLSIVVSTLKDLIQPYDYFLVHTYGHFIFLPATSMKNSNIKNCNFQQIQGLQGFDFSQIKDKNLTATNFTFVDLTNASFEGCNLIGTVFQIADIKGANFLNSQTNENTDFENTQNTGLAINTENINFGELQNNANETHSRSKFIINNRNKFKEFCDTNTQNSVTNPRNLFKYSFSQGNIIFLNKLLDIINKIISNQNIDSISKDYLKNNFSRNFKQILNEKLKYSTNEQNLLNSNFDKIINEEFINILILLKNPLQNGEPKWCWLQLVYYSFIYLITRPKIYIHMFLQYYFNEVFNAHGQGSMSCTLGMVERLVTIHSQATEGYLMTLLMEEKDINQTIINSIKKFSTDSDTKEDENLTIEFVKNFNKPNSIYSSDLNFKDILIELKDVLVTVNNYYKGGLFGNIENIIKEKIDSIETLTINELEKIIEEYNNIKSIRKRRRRK